MKILLTGSEGYIGSHVKRALKAHDVFCIDLKLGTDIRRPVMVDVDVIVHLAALVKVGESVMQPWPYYDTNVNGTKNVIDATQGAKFILASTGAAFNPTSPYGTSKVAAEDLVKAYCKNYTIFRFFNVGGYSVQPPTNEDGVFGACKRAALNGKFTIFGNDYDTKDGTAVRDYIHVDDIANAIVRAVEEPAANTPYEPLGSGKSYTVREYAEAFCAINGVDFDIIKGPRRAGDLAVSEVPFMSRFMQPTKTLEDIVRL